MCQSREQLAALPPGPKAVLATLPSLEAGPAQELFVEWAGDPHSLILFTERPPVRSQPCPALLIFHMILRPVAPPEDSYPAQSFTACSACKDCLIAVTALSAPTALQARSLASTVSQGTTSGQPLTLKLELGHREPLQGKELEAFYASRAAHALLEEEEEEPQPSLTPR